MQGSYPEVCCPSLALPFDPKLQRPNVHVYTYGTPQDMYLYVLCCGVGFQKSLTTRLGGCWGHLGWPSCCQPNRLTHIRDIASLLGLSQQQKPQRAAVRHVLLHAELSCSTPSSLSEEPSRDPWRRTGPTRP